MMELVDGPYDGKSLDRDPVPLRTGVGIINPDGDAEVYEMHVDGLLHHVGPYSRMDSAALLKELS